MALSWYRDKPGTKDKHHHKQWHAARGKYVVRWRDQYEGVEIPAGFHALVRIMLPDGRDMLDMVWRFKVFRTRRAAFAACEDHAEGRDPKAEYKRRKASAMNRRRGRRKKPSLIKQDRAIIKTVLETIPPPDMETVKLAQQEAIAGHGSTIDEILAELPAQDLQPKKRKPRSDKGKKRGPRKPKENQ